VGVVTKDTSVNKAKVVKMRVFIVFSFYEWWVLHWVRSITVSLAAREKPKNPEILTSPERQAAL
jgi:hypothetical protein